MVNGTSKYDIDLAVSGRDVWLTAEMMAKKMNADDWGMSLSGIVTTEHVAEVLTQWLPRFLSDKVEYFVNNLDRVIDDAPDRLFREFFNGVTAKAGLAHAHYFPEPTGKYGDKWVCASHSTTPGDYSTIDHPEHGFFDDEDECKAKCHELNVALEQARNAEKVAA